MTFDGIRFFHEYRIPYTTTGSNVSRGWVGLRCPFCGDTSDHLGFNISNGGFSCWRCGPKSGVKTIARLLKIANNDAIKIYSEFLGRKPSPATDTGKPRKANASQVILPGQEFTRLETKYLKKRRLLDKVEQYDLRSGGIIGEWAFRIVIPIKLNDIIVSATGRYIIDGEDTLRYKTLSIEREVVHHKHIFLGLDFIKDNRVVLVEGPIDAIRGGPGFISGFGINLMEEQIALLTRFDSVIFLFDNEEKAQEQAHIYAETVASLCNSHVEVVRMDGQYKDLGEMPEDEIIGIRRELGIA